MKILDNTIFPYNVFTISFLLLFSMQTQKRTDSQVVTEDECARYSSITSERKYSGPLVVTEEKQPSMVVIEEKHTELQIVKEEKPKRKRRMTPCCKKSSRTLQGNF